MPFSPSFTRFRGITAGKIIIMEATGGNETFDVVVDSKTYRTHVFTASGLQKLDVTRKANSKEYSTLECLVIAGGGGGGEGENYNINPSGGGGGGAGGILDSEYFVTSNSVNVFVGVGGANSGHGVSGGNSYVGESGVFNITALGGGGGGSGAAGNATANGGSNNPENANNRGYDGGSGGGGGRSGNPGFGLQPSYEYPGFGNDGYAGQGTGAAVVSPAGVGKNGGGGGGSGVAAFSRSGGVGLAYNWHNEDQTSSLFGNGGTGGSMGGYSVGTQASVNTGSGGGGGSGPHPNNQYGSNAPGGSGGSGIVVVRYRIDTD
jgi:hypothetical protein